MKDVSISAAALAEDFGRFRRGYDKWLRTETKFSGVSVPRMRLLEILYKSGPQVMNQLGEELGVSGRTVTALVDGLSVDGLVERLPHASNRRAKLIQLTEPGHEFCDQVHDRFVATGAALFEVLNASERESLRQVLRRLGDRLQTAD